MTLERELQIATGLAYRAGAALRRHQTELTHVWYKAHGELVTAADVEADAIIRGGLEAAFPADAVFSEETPDSPIRLTRRRVWIVDPLDSTSNFTERGDEYSVSIGLAVDGRAALGIVYNPAREEMFAGYEPAGMTLNGAPVRVRETSDLAHARVTVSRKEWRRGLDPLAAKVSVISMASMAYKLARVAAGLDDAVFSVTPRKEWGICARVALVRAAGGASACSTAGRSCSTALSASNRWGWWRPARAFTASFSRGSARMPSTRPMRSGFLMNASQVSAVIENVRFPD